MAIGSVYLTKRGRNLVAKGIAGTEIIFTRFAIGDGYLNGAAIEDLNNVISFKYSVSISKKQFNEVGKVKLSGNFTNTDVGGFYYRELGLFATDPDLGEVLYAYGNADDRAEYIPISSEEIYEKTIVLNAYISNAASVTAVIDESLVFATVEDLNNVSETVDSHLANISNPHGVTPAQIGAVTPSEMDTAVLTEKTAVQTWAKDTFSNPNLLINGDFQVWQRGTSFNSYSGYTADRFKATTATMSVNQSTDTPVGFKYSANISKVAGNNDYCVMTLEDMAGKLYGKDITISFYAKKGTVSFLRYLYIIGDVSVSYFTSLELSDSWTRYSVTFNGNAIFSSNTSTANLAIRFTTNSTESGNFYLTGIKLELGVVATPFVPRPYGEELALCQRYYQIRSVNTIADVDLRPNMRVTPTKTAVTGGFAYDAEI